MEMVSNRLVCFLETPEHPGIGKVSLSAQFLAGHRGQISRQPSQGPEELNR